MRTARESSVAGLLAVGATAVGLLVADRLGTPAGVAGLALVLVAAAASLGFGELELWAKTGLMLIGGYVAIARGFAYLSPFPDSIPVFVGELAIVGLLVLMPHRRYASAFLGDGVGRWVMLWLAYGMARVALSFTEMAFIAAKATSVVYYAVFVYFGFALGREASRVIRTVRWLQWVFFAHILHSWLGLGPLDITAMSPVVYGDIPLFGLGTGGMPYINTVTAGFFFMWVACGRSLAETWSRRLGVGLSFGALFVIQARTGLLAAGLCLLVSGVWGSWRRTLRVCGSVAAVLLCVALVTEAVGARPVGSKGPVSLGFVMAQMASVIGLTPRGEFVDYESLLMGPREGRLEIWSDVIDETIRQDWILGRGFRESLVEVELVDSSRKRSPHNSFIAVFGYLGVCGLAIFLAMLAHVMWVTIRGLRDARAVAARRTADLLLWLVIAVMANVVGGVFGVIWDSPVHAAPAYFAMGLAVAVARAASARRWYGDREGWVTLWERGIPAHHQGVMAPRDRVGPGGDIPWRRPAESWVEARENW